MKTFGSLTHRHGIIVDCNDKACDELWLSRDEIIGQNLFDYMADKDKKKALDIMTKHEEYLYEAQFVHPQGGDFHVTIWPESSTVSAHDERTVYFKIKPIE